MKMKKGVFLVVFLMLFGLGFGLESKAVPQNNGEADLVVGQQNFTGALRSQGGAISANGLSEPWDTFYDGSKYFVADTMNNRVLIYNSLPTSNNASADVVVGQVDMLHNGSNQGNGSIPPPTDKTLYYPTSVFSDGTKLFIADQGNNRVLIFNSIPTSNNAAANVVVGQPNMTSSTSNPGGVSAKTLNYPKGIMVVGTKLFIADANNNRVLIFNTVPTTDYAAASVVVGQADMTHNLSDQGGSAGANTLDYPEDIYSEGTKLFVSDQNNNRVLIFNSIPVNNNASASVVIGQSSMSATSANQGGSAGANTLRSPWGITASGNSLLIADTGNGRVLVYSNVPTGNNTSANSVIGRASFTDSTLLSAASNTFFDPKGMQAYGNRLLVADADYHRVLFFKLKPTLAEVSAVSGTSFTPSYTFSSDETGTITYAGDCSSSTTAASVGNNTITFNALSAGTHSNCQIAVTNGAGFSSSVLSVSSFTLYSSGATNREEELSASPSSIVYNKKKSKKIKVTLTAKNLNLAKGFKKSWVTVRINNRKMKIIRVRNSGANLSVVTSFAYGKWARNNYNVSLSYKNKVKKSWQKGVKSGDGIITIY